MSTNKNAPYDTDTYANEHPDDAPPPPRGPSAASVALTVVVPLAVMALVYVAAHLFRGLAPP